MQKTKKFTPGQRDQFIEEHLPLVRFAARKMYGTNPAGVLEFEDLVGHGTLGLIQAVDRFDDTMGIPFSGFALRRIRGAMLDAMRSLDAVGRSDRAIAKRIDTTFNTLALSLGREPTSSEVQAASGVGERRYWSARAAVDMSVVPFEPSSDDEPGWGDRVADGAPPVSSRSEHAELTRALAAAIASLPERNRQILSLYYLEHLTMRDVACVLGISETRVSQLMHRTHARLRANRSLAAAA